MDGKTYSLIENYMASCMEDSAHDKEHIYRVLYNALDIAETESRVDQDILITACLLHDIGRGEQFRNPNVCHALAGGDMAYKFLTENGFGADFAENVRHCIRAHRFRKSEPPQSMEAKILFDADKLDVSGAVGIARTLIYRGTVGEPIYSVLRDGTVSDGTDDTESSFFKEYKFKLEKLYDKFYTQRGRELAENRRKHAVEFYGNLLGEVRESYEKGRERLSEIIMPSDIQTDNQKGE